MLGEIHGRIHAFDSSAPLGPSNKSTRDVLHPNYTCSSFFLQLALQGLI